MALRRSTISLVITNSLMRFWDGNVQMASSISPTVSPTQILALDGASNAEQYSGDYTEYTTGKRHSDFLNQHQRVISRQRARASRLKKRLPRSSNVKRHARLRRRTAKGAKKKKEATRGPQAVEAEIAEIEKRLAALAEEMGRSEVVRSPERLAQLNEEYRQVDELLRALYEEWEPGAAEATDA